MGKTVPGTRSYHHYTPISTTEISYKRTSEHEFEQHFNLSKAVQVINDDAPLPNLNDFVACRYDTFWWVGIVDEIEAEKKDFKIKFMHPHGPSKRFSWPERDDSCWVPIKNMIAVIGVPTTRSGRIYEIDIDDFNKVVKYKDAFQNIKISDDEVQNSCLNDNAEEIFTQHLNENVTQNEIETVKAEYFQTEEISDTGKYQELHTTYNSQNPKDIYYFYQASDGQPIYLHPLNVKMLIEEFRSLKACPEKITAKIVQIENNTMDENLRNKFRYLNHLPLHCEYIVAELKFDEIVSKKTYATFFQDLKKRNLMRQNKKKVERRWEQKVKSDENKKKGLFPSASVDLGCLKQFPTCSEAGITDIDADFFGLSVSPDTDSNQNVSSSASFAQMLRDGKAKNTPVWGRPCASAAVIHEPQADRNNDDNDDSHSVPSYNKSFCDDIPTFVNYPEGELQEKVNGNGKKKKFKKKLLFSTNMNRTK
ncbi:RING finger protein 10 [Nymphon striatum]|nr:RING finger protein 10 [Nymphon striatum]